MGYIQVMNISIGHEDINGISMGHKVMKILMGYLWVMSLSVGHKVITGLSMSYVWAMWLVAPSI